MSPDLGESDDVPEDNPEGLSDDEMPLDDDLERYGDDEGADLVACPHCGQEVYDNADRCPHCRMNIISGRDPAKRPRRWAWWVMAAAILTAIAFALSYGIGYCR